MSAKLSIQVKRESVFMGGIEVLIRKLPVTVILDGQEHKLAHRKESYEFEIEPFVEHSIQFLDPRRKRKAIIYKIMRIYYKLFSLIPILGSLISDITTSLNDAVFQQKSDGAYTFSLQEGEVYRISCRCTQSGDVKIRELQD